MNMNPEVVGLFEAWFYDVRTAWGSVASSRMT
jgi:hypothetical protein